MNSGILALRQRSLWEALDAGLLLWRRNLGYLILFFALPFWICAFTLLLLGDSEPALLVPDSVAPLFCAWFILWWLNPLFDRLVLHVVARRYFEPGLAFRALCRGLGAALGRGLVGDLLWRRLSPWRAAVMPLRVLEAPVGRRGRKAGPKKRRRIADRKRALGGFHFCIFLSLWCPLLQWTLVLGEICFVVIVSQLFFNGALGFGDLFGNGGLYVYTLWCINYLVVESLYVCMGFGLYLNSRVEVEGWDIELLFRKFATRRRKVLGLLLLCLGLARPAGVFGQAPTPDPQAEILPPQVGATMPAETLEEILKRDIEGERTTWGIRFKEEEEEEEPVESGLSRPRPPAWMDLFRNAGAAILRGLLVLAIVALALACALFVYRRRRNPSPSRPERPTAAPVPPRVPSPESLVEEAGRLHQQGSIRAAWGLCYTASLAALSRYRQIRFPPGATEYRCLALVRRRPGALERAFADLIHHWVGLAYGGIEPAAGAFGEALAWVLSLCGESPGAEAPTAEAPRAGQPGAVHG
ncbi:MAG: DUF4129 domain-containing protein [Treponema sp.]|nr:DUF4129 domain-containing protein [Treponema sp.]